MQAAAMTALVQQGAGDADVFEGVADDLQGGGVLSGMVGGGAVDVENGPAGNGEGTDADEDGGVLVQAPLLDGRERVALNGFPGRCGAGIAVVGIEPVPAVGEESAQKLAGFGQGEGGSDRAINIF